MDAQDERIPVTLLTGFLGSGKTTLLNAWLRSPQLSNAAVIVNEFGEVGIDHALIASSSDNTIELSTGCLCCTVSGDLVNTLRELIVKREQRDIRAFDSVVIETTGLADPGPVIQALMTFPVARKYRLSQVITTVDAVNGTASLEQHPEAMKQVSVADAIIVTKTDIGTTAAREVQDRLKALNPGAKQRRSALGHYPEPGDFAPVNIYDPRTKIADAWRWLQAAKTDVNEKNDGQSYRRYGATSASRHASSVNTFTLEFDHALEWEHVANWLDALVMCHGPDLLRVKGILDIAGRERPVVVQAVQTLFHPPHELPAWPAGERKSRIVFITRNLTRAFVLEVLQAIRTRPVLH